MHKPRFSVLVPVYKPDISELNECIDSVLGQMYTSWELILVADGPQPSDVYEAMERDDPRVIVVRRAENGGIAAASQDGLDVASGEFLALLDNDDVIPDRALREIAAAIDADERVDMIYTDEDKLSSEGIRQETFAKPGFSFDRLRCHMYVGHFGVYRTDLARSVGGFRPGFDGSQDHDLALRVAERARVVAHVPQVLYHWRQSANSVALDPAAKDWAYEAGLRVVQSHLERTGMQAQAERDPQYPGNMRIEPDLRDHPLVSIVIPTVGGEGIVMAERVRFVELCVLSILAHTTYPNFEIVLVEDQNVDAEYVEWIGSIRDERVRTVRNHRSFNFSEACNLGALHARGAVLVFSQ